MSLKRWWKEGNNFLLEFDIRNHFRMGPVKYHNVIGVIRDTEYPDEYVLAGGSDHAYFAINGVPTLSFTIKDPKGYDFDYNEIWHTERDTYNKSIPEYQEHTAICTAVVLYGLANLDHLLDRTGLYAE